MNSFLEYRDCPSCGRNDFEVLLESTMQNCDFRQEAKTVYMIAGGKHGRHVKCRNCDLVYVDPIEKASEINGAYFERRNGDVPIIRKTRLIASRSQVGLMRRHGNGTRLLDVGCGEGFFLFNASRAGYTSKGIEISQDVAEYARTEFSLDVEAKPFEELAFPTDHFDVVTLWQVLEHLPYPLAVLKETHRILKPGGLVVTSTPNIEGILARIFRRRWWNLRVLHVNQFTAKTLTAILENAGFENTSRVSYKETISLLMLIIPTLKYLDLYRPLGSLFSLNSMLGRVMNRIVLTYPSTLDNCTVIGFK